MMRPRIREFSVIQMQNSVSEIFHRIAACETVRGLRRSARLQSKSAHGRGKLRNELPFEFDSGLANKRDLFCCPATKPDRHHDSSLGAR